MKSIITTVVEKAEENGHFLNDNDFQSINEGINKIFHYLEEVEKLSGLVDTVTKESSDACFNNYYSLVKSSESEEQNDILQQYYQDLGNYIRLINYCLIVGDTDPLYQWGINGIKELYDSLDIPIKPLIEGVKDAKNYLCNFNIFLTNLTAELRKYFDYLIHQLTIIDQY